MTRTLIPIWVVLQIQLMIRLRIIPLSRLGNLRSDLSILPPLLANLCCDLIGNSFLLFVVPKDRTAILRPRIATLSIQRRRIMHLVEELQYGLVAQLFRIKHYLQRLRMSCRPGAYCAIRRRGGLSADVADSCVQKARRGGEVLAVEMFYAPETASCDGCCLGAGWDRHWLGGGGHAAEWAEEFGEDGCHANCYGEGHDDVLERGRFDVGMCCVVGVWLGIWLGGLVVNIEFGMGWIWNRRRLMWLGIWCLLRLRMMTT